MPSAARRILVTVLVGLVAFGAGAGTASAHARIEGSDPAPGALLDTAPGRVTLTFGEPVEPTRGAVQVFDDHLVRVDQDDVTTVDRDGYQVGVDLRSGLGAGTYTVSFRISSADTHPVSGSFTYSVGAASAVTGEPPTGSDPAAGALLGVARWLGYAGLALGPGALLVLLTLWPAGLAQRAVRRLLAVGFATLLVGTVAAMLLEGVLASGAPLSALWTDPALLDTRSARFDTLHAARLYLLLAVGVTVLAVGPAEAAAARSRRRSRLPQPGPRPGVRQVLLAAAGAGTLALLGTWTFAGHAASGPQSPLAVVADLAHLAAMAVWLGGLALLVVVLRTASGVVGTAELLPRFSRLAFGAVTVLVATGTYQAVRQVGSVPALTGTSFGRLVLVKLALVILLVALGNRARHWVQRHHPVPVRELRPVPAAPGAAGAVPSGHQDPDALPAPVDAAAVAALRRGVLAEVGVAVAVLAVTAVLVAAVPARDDYVAPSDRTVAGPVSR